MAVVICDTETTVGCSGDRIFDQANMSAKGVERTSPTEQACDVRDKATKGIGFMASMLLEIYDSCSGAPQILLVPNEARNHRPFERCETNGSALSGVAIVLRSMQYLRILYMMLGFLSVR